MENDTFHLSTENRQTFQRIPKTWDYEITPWLQTFRLLFLRTNSISLHRWVFQYWIEVWGAFEVRPRSSSGTLIHGHSVNGEYLNVHMKNGQANCVTNCCWVYLLTLDSRSEAVFYFTELFGIWSFLMKGKNKQQSSNIKFKCRQFWIQIAYVGNWLIKSKEPWNCGKAKINN